VSTLLRLEDLRRAWDARDPELVRLVELLANQPEESPHVPVREGALTFATYLREVQSPAFHRKPREEQAHYRIEQMKALEAPDAEVPLPERLRLHEIVWTLWTEGSPFARSCLLRIIAGVPLTYGPWRALKRIFKEAEAAGDTEMLGALAARLDMAYAGAPCQVSRPTLAYMVRRAWRLLRRLAVGLPAAYPDAAVEVLVHYTNDTRWPGTWVANHIFYHETRQYNRNRFRLSPLPANLLQHRAFAELWQRSPRPLFTLLERARSDQVRDFAAAALKTDFRAALRDVEPAWVARLVILGSRAVDDFVVWILSNVPRFEQAAFRTLGLHEAVLRLFDSPSNEARAYAAEYARTHARDQGVAELVRLANNSHPAVRKVAADLLLARDPRKDVGLEAWGQLLETQHGFALAARVLREHFGARELTPEWFQVRLFSISPKAFQFVRDLLPQVHPVQKLGPGFFVALLDRLEGSGHAPSVNVASFALDKLAGFDLGALEQDFLQRLLLHPLTGLQAAAWIDEGRLKAQALGVDFLKRVAYHPAWEGDPWLAQLGQRYPTWAQNLPYREDMADRVLGWLGDVRGFSPKDLGLGWLLELVMRSEPRYHDFAVEYLIKAFVPADFALAEAGSSPQAAAPANLGGASFLFTGKLATMQRKAAEDRVRQAGGTVFSAVSPKLHYLVVGDEGSPLYGHGSKGTKQLKAEEINAAGGNIKIISETAFLRMLAGGQTAHSADATLAGCERLWQMAVAPGVEDAPLGQFARKYLRYHHLDIGLEKTGRPVDPGAEIPAEFLTFERVQPLFTESRQPQRDLALDLARWEFARWAPPVPALVRLCEAPYSDVRVFVAKALLAEDTPEHKRYRIDTSALSPAAVYSFCESADEGTRMLGMRLIQRSPRLRVPEELFRLTESPDRKVRAFVIRALWSLYRDRGITPDWKPAVPPQPTVGAAARKAATTAAEGRGAGPPPRPAQPPAGGEGMQTFLRRILFEIPPGRLEPSKIDEPEGIQIRMKPLPARRAKLALVEVMRDLALEDRDFARAVLPVLEEFMTSRGKSEHDACLVAVTRIRSKV
jgi:hypothetical protein